MGFLRPYFKRLDLSLGYSLSPIRSPVTQAERLCYPIPPLTRITLKKTLQTG